LKTRRRAFTLVELLIAIVIIAILIGMLLPALSGARRTARVTQVATEIKALDAAIADFKATFGFEPPSSITLYEAATGWATTAAADDRAVIRRMFPRFNFALARDLDGDGDTTGSFTLNGSQCLVFFLGGRQSSGAMIGFSKNPNNPFETSVSASKIGPFMAFETSRLEPGPGGMPVYRDPIPNQTTAYRYIHSDSYASGSGAYTEPGGTVYHKPDSYQIISPGFDADFGPGGDYDPDTADAKLAGTREAERDNITNFKQGTLAN
jgi:general secretion pathway protein G